MQGQCKTCAALVARTQTIKTGVLAGQGADGPTDCHTCVTWAGTYFNKVGCDATVLVLVPLLSLLVRYC